MEVANFGAAMDTLIDQDEVFDIPLKILVYLLPFLLYDQIFLSWQDAVFLFSGCISILLPRLSKVSSQC